MGKNIFKIADLAQLTRTVDYTDDQAFEVRGLTLKEMVKLFLDFKDPFLALLGQGLDLESLNPEVLAPFLISAPEMVAAIIAMASDAPQSALIVETKMPATVQLIALSEIWQASVPDPKKARALLSEVTALLHKLSDDNALNNPASEKKPVTSSPMTSLTPLTS